MYPPKPAVPRLPSKVLDLCLRLPSQCPVGSVEHLQTGPSPPKEDHTPQNSAGHTVVMAAKGVKV